MNLLEHRRARLSSLDAVAFASKAFAAAGLAADGKVHRGAIRVDWNDPPVMNLALKGAANVIEYYRAGNEAVEV
ncbi:hypothetical protein, partial [Bradyrhizobium sp. URHD0069]|uniref:hypothetical protein n=1 Tax=Bradyrhizobium sp. URHD0069 TaxID=1380355 RepID=UPI000494FBCB